MYFKSGFDLRLICVILHILTRCLLRSVSIRKKKKKINDSRINIIIIYVIRKRPQARHTPLWPRNPFALSCAILLLIRFCALPVHGVCVFPAVNQPTNIKVVIKIASKYS